MCGNFHSLINVLNMVCSCNGTFKTEFCSLHITKTNCHEVVQDYNLINGLYVTKNSGDVLALNIMFVSFFGQLIKTQFMSTFVQNPIKYIIGFFF